jgi:hypothetical protein
VWTCGSPARLTTCVKRIVFLLAFATAQAAGGGIARSSRRR